MMTNGDPEGRIFLSYPQTYIALFLPKRWKLLCEDFVRGPNKLMIIKIQSYQKGLKFTIRLIQREIISK